MTAPLLRTDGWTDSEYLFELDHDVFGQLHVLEHPFQLTGERCPTFCTTNKQQHNVDNQIEQLALRV